MFGSPKTSSIRKGFAVRLAQSVLLTVVACTLTNTSLSVGIGWSICPIFILLGVVYCLLMDAIIPLKKPHYSASSLSAIC